MRRGKYEVNLGAIRSGIECEVRMDERIVPADLYAEIWRLDLRRDLRLPQCRCEEDDEDERNGEKYCASRGLLFITVVKTLGVLR